MSEYEMSMMRAQQQAAINNLVDRQNHIVAAHAVQHLVADPRETQLIAMFRGVDDRAQQTIFAMMGVAYSMHKRVPK